MSKKVFEMNENNVTINSKKKYASPVVETIKFSSVDIIRTSGEWDLPEIPIDTNPLEIGI